MIFIGIDPGFRSGAIATIEFVETPSGGKSYEYFLRHRVATWPLKDRTEADILKVLRDLILISPRYSYAVIEKVHAFPKQGIASSFKFGRNYGHLTMALTALKIPYEEVAAGVWQRKLGCLSRGDKNITKRKAQQLFPQVWVHLASGKITEKPPTHAVADALLLAEYCREKKGRG